MSGRRSPGLWMLDSARVAGVFLLTTVFAAIALCVVPSLVGGPRPVVVETGSMSPSVRPGDVVLTRPDAASAEVGSIITFHADDGDGLVTHRVVDLDDGRFVTRGDANPTNDSSTVAPVRVEGVAVLVVPFIGRPAVWWTTHDWLSLVAVALVLLTAIGGALLPPARQSDRAVMA